MLKGCILARYQKDLKKEEEEERKQWKKIKFKTCIIVLHVIYIYMDVYLFY